MKVQRQQDVHDCGVAALASFMGRTYADVYVAAVAVSPAFGRRADGLRLMDLERVARAFGFQTKRVDYRRVDLEEDEGVLGVNWNRPKDHGGAVGHWVVLRRGLICEPDTTGSDVVEADVYLTTRGGRVGTLLALS